jgi:hypothetical protein
MQYIFCRCGGNNTVKMLLSSNVLLMTVNDIFEGKRYKKPS